MHLLVCFPEGPLYCLQPTRPVMWMELALTFLQSLPGSPDTTPCLCVHKFWFSSVAQPCPTLCDPMNCSTPGLPVHHQLLEFTQTHIQRIGDAIQPSHPLSSPSPPPSIFPSIRVFPNESALHIRWPKYWILVACVK